MLIPNNIAYLKIIIKMMTKTIKSQKELLSMDLSDSEMEHKFSIELVIHSPVPKLLKTDDQQD